MIDSDYERRIKLNLHEGYISNSSEMNDKSKDILYATFWHIFACYNTEEPTIRHGVDTSIKGKGTVEDERIPQTWDLPISRQWLSWNFYNNGFYVVPVIQNDIVGKKMTLDNFIAQTVSKRSVDERNELNFLVGEAGIGKTAFLNYLITKKGGELSNNGTWFLRYNVDSHNLKNEVLSPRSLILGIISKLRRVINHFADEYPELSDTLISIKNDLPSNRESDQLEGLGIDQIKHSFASTVAKISELLDKKFCLLLDNIDYIFHVNDRKCFLSGINAEIDQSLKNTHAIVREFSEDQQLSKMSANILMCVRTESYLYLENTVQFYGPNSPYKNRKNYYKIHTPQWEDVLLKRVEFLCDYLDQLSTVGVDKETVNSLKAEFNPFLNIIREQISTIGKTSGRKIILSALEHLTNEGMRDFLNFFANYAWVSTWIKNKSSADLFVRYIEHKPIGLMVYMMNGRLLYSQTASGFPNIFYLDSNNSDEDSVIMEEKGAQSVVSLNHSHSYFLKLLILKYISKREGKATKTADVVKAFCTSQPGNQEKCYSEVAVRSLLGSLADRTKSNAIRMIRDASSGHVFIQSLELTKRGKYLLDTLCWRFYYLQLIIDDPYLDIPASKWSDFKFDRNKSYDYLVADEVTFSRKSREMVLYKIDRVTKFLATLKVETELEQIRYEGALKNLERNGVTLPNLDKQLKRFISEIMRLNKWLKLFPSEAQLKENILNVFDRFVSTYTEALTK